MSVIIEPIVTNANQVEINEEVERDRRSMKSLLRKIDKKLMPLLMFLLFFSYLDRLNIGNVRLLNIETDLHLSSTEYQWAISIFFISYVLFEVPSNLMMRQVRPSRWIGSLMLAWGVIMMLFSLVKDSTGLYIGRFFLAYIIEKNQSNEKDLSGWQQIFLIEGGLTIVLAFVTLRCLADYPATSSWLDQCHRDLLTARLRNDADIIHDDNEMSRLDAIKFAFSDWKVLLFMMINISALTPFFSLLTYLPSIILTLDNYSNATAQLLTVPIYITSFGTSIFCGWNAGRLNERSTHIMIFHLIAIIGFIYLIFANRRFYVGIFLVSFGVFSPYPLIPSWVSVNIAGKTKRAVAIALVTGFGCLGGIISGQIYRDTDDPQYHRAHTILLSIVSFNFMLILVMRVLLNRLNDDERSSLLNQNSKMRFVT